jgi:hypothetical protein
LIKISQKITEKAIAKVIKNINNKAIIKMISAIFSNDPINFIFFDRIDKNENILLIVSKIQATPVNSSMRDTSLNLDIFSEVKTTRQNPNKLEEVVKICCDLLFSNDGLFYDDANLYKQPIIFSGRFPSFRTKSRSEA